jgi:hypothetical protein
VFGNGESDIRITGNLVWELRGGHDGQAGIDSESDYSESDDSESDSRDRSGCWPPVRWARTLAGCSPLACGTRARVGTTRQVRTDRFMKKAFQSFLEGEKVCSAGGSRAETVQKRWEEGGLRQRRDKLPRVCGDRVEGGGDNGKPGRTGRCAVAGDQPIVPLGRWI